MKYLYIVLTFFLVACGNESAKPVVEQQPEEVVSPEPISNLSAAIASNLARKPAEASQADVKDLVDAQNTFSLSLFQTSKSFTSQGNTLVAPYGVNAIYAQLYAATANGSYDELTEVFHFDTVADVFYPAVNTLDQILAQSANDVNQLKIFNGMWAQRNYDYSMSYLENQLEYFGSEIQSLDFIDQPDAVTANIDNWVAEKLNGVISYAPQIGDEERMILANAVYFDMPWQTPFPAENSFEGDFTLLDKENIVVPMMAANIDARFYANADEKIIEIPLDNTEWSMLLLTSSVDNFEDMVNNLTTEKIVQLVELLSLTSISLTIPRFSFETSITVVSTLTDFGVASIFDPDNADLSNINEQLENDLYVNSSSQKNVITIDESGVNSASITGLLAAVKPPPMTTPPTTGVIIETYNPEICFIVIPATTCDEPVEEVVNLNTPFVYIMRHSTTGSLLFLGLVINPLN